MLASYRMYGFYRAQIIVTFAIFGASVPLLIAASIRDQDGPGLVFVLCWIGILCWNAYWFLLRFCYRLDLGEQSPLWWTPVRSGQAPLNRLRAIRPFWIAPNVAVFEFVDGPRILIFITRGLVEFTTHVHAAAPQATVKLGLFARFAERLPGRSGFRLGK